MGSRNGDSAPKSPGADRRQMTVGSLAVYNILLLQAYRFRGLSEQELQVLRIAADNG